MLVAMKENKKPCLSIVIPTYHRSYLLKKLSLAIDEAVAPYVERYEVIFVDDAASKENREVLSALVASSVEKKKIKALLLKANSGQQNATLAGIRHSCYEYILTLDDDLEYDLSVIPELFSDIDKGYDVAYAVPFSDTFKGRRRYRKLGTSMKEWVFCLALGKPKNLQLTSYRLMNREIADFVARDDSRSVYISAQILKKTKKISNVSMKKNTRYKLVSGYNLYKLSALLWKTFLQYNSIKILQGLKKQGSQYEVKEIME